MYEGKSIYVKRKHWQLQYFLINKELRKDVAYSEQSSKHACYQQLKIEAKKCSTLYVEIGQENMYTLIFAIWICGVEGFGYDQEIYGRTDYLRSRNKYI